MKDAHFQAERVERISCSLCNTSYKGLEIQQGRVALTVQPFLLPDGGHWVVGGVTGENQHVFVLGVALHHGYEGV